MPDPAAEWVFCRTMLVLLGDALTAADIVVGGVLAVGNHAGVLDAAPDRVGAYFERLRARPAYARAAERTESLLTPS